jgi:hypothetical protein
MRSDGLKYGRPARHKERQTRWSWYLHFAILGTCLKILHSAYIAWMFSTDLRTKATFALHGTNKLILCNRDGECSLCGTHESLRKTIRFFFKGIEGVKNIHTSILQYKKYCPITYNIILLEGITTVQRAVTYVTDLPDLRYTQIY